MTSAQIRQSYLDFFAARQHAIVPSSSLMPSSPNLLFTNSGMNQFVPIFLGEMACPYKPGRAADTQKCIRAGGKHNDLEDVGLDTYHHTFFEMLGNWSFGDYFKREAIEWAWDLVANVWKFPKDRLYATVYKPGPNDPAEFDQEAYDIWTEVFTKAGVDPKKHICYGNRKDNFWMMGDTGPCGPCSEIHVDLTPNGDGGPALVNTGDARCMEIWNLVFIQFNANVDGSFVPLPAKHVDTGMGFERVTGIMQCTKNFTDFTGPISNYNTDIFRPIFDVLEKRSGKTYRSTLSTQGSLTKDPQEKIDIAFRVIADHIRTLSFSIADGIMPGNEGRNYVLRRILRRAVRYGRELGLHDLFFYELVDVLADTMGHVFPEIQKQKELVKKVIKSEEESFSRTLDRGIEIFQGVVSRLQGKTFPGDEAFKLYDTYGFPLDLTQLMAREKGLAVDEAAFQTLMNEQRERSKAAHRRDIIEVVGQAETAIRSEFVGYDNKENVSIAACDYQLQLPSTPDEKPHAFLYFTPTPFYGEMGGQVGDEGFLSFNGHRINILETQRGGPGVVCHITEDVHLLDEISFPLVANLNLPRRELIEAHHSVTHIMHWALRKVLGNTVHQKGSYVGPDRLRFDFSHLQAMTPEQIKEVEKLVNGQIETKAGVSWSERPYADVKNDPSILQFFGDKYGDVVRVVDIGGFSKELCGGTHVVNTSKIGPFRIVSEGAIAAGVRRIEAIAGEALRPFLQLEFSKQEERFQALNKKRAITTPLVATATQGNVTDVWRLWETRSEQLVKIENDLRTWEKDQAKQREADFSRRASEKAAELLEQKGSVGATPLIVANLGAEETGILQFVVDALKKSFQGVIVLGCHQEGKVGLIASVHPSFTGKVQAGKIIQQLAPIVGGKGGGKPELAQGGGTQPEKLAQALAEVEKLIS